MKLKRKNPIIENTIETYTCGCDKNNCNHKCGCYDTSVINASLSLIGDTTASTGYKNSQSNISAK